jgi:phosphate transport system protein
MPEETPEVKTPRADKFHRELQALKEELLKLARLAETAMDRAVTAFMEGDPELARQVILGDDDINQLDEAIDGECVRLIALYQPVAIDLRQVMAVDHLIAELERIGDLAVNIAEETLFLYQLPPGEFHPDLAGMARQVKEMIENSIKAFIDQDVRLARQVCKADTFVDDLDRSIINDLIADMARDRQNIPLGQSQINIVRNLERGGDHATNIAEQVVYMAEGESVRHRCQG